jgi:hypothetical protein
MGAESQRCAHQKAEKYYSDDRGLVNAAEQVSD